MTTYQNELINNVVAVLGKKSERAQFDIRLGNRMSQSKKKKCKRLAKLYWMTRGE